MMHNSTFSPAVGYLLFLSCVASSFDIVTGQETVFQEQVAPLLVRKCLGCHSGNNTKGGLDLTSRESLITGGDSGSSIAPGNVDESLLWDRVAKNEMPPKNPLADEEKLVLRHWIEQGATWAGGQLDPLAQSTDERAGYDWWSLQPLQSVVVPSIHSDAIQANPIDAFLQVKLEQEGMTSSSEANRRTLIRRLSFDLLGIPPSYEDVSSFQNDPNEQAYEKLVDRMLQSPRYGERWARHWLDIARYGESDGFERNSARPNSWHYRDWLIHAWNADMPFDQFCREQIAGDILNPDDLNSIRATGFLVAGVHNTVLGNDMMRLAARQDELEDTIGAVGQAFLGLTVNCARCHDHKYDPISQEDYYRISSSLSGFRHGERAIAVPAIQSRISSIEGEVRNLQSALRDLEAPAMQRVVEKRKLSHETLKTLPPQPIFQVSFGTSRSSDLQVHKMHEVGSVKHDIEGVHVSGNGYLKSDPLGRAIKAKTLEAWVKLDQLEQQGGGVVSLQDSSGGRFDAIVFGELQTKRWMAGSDGFSRTKSFEGFDEDKANSQWTQVAITYTDSGAIQGYVNGARYGSPYQSNGPLQFSSDAVILIGCRHEPAGGNRMLAGTIAHARLYDFAMSEEQVAASFALGGNTISEEELLSELTDEDKKQRQTLRERHQSLSNQISSLRQRERESIYCCVPAQPEATRFLMRGDVTLPKQIVTPGALRAVSPSRFDFQLPENAPEGNRREMLANWITNDGGPLLARVIVNRLWHYHFGVGLVETPSDFGFNGGRPSHPELLEWLALELVRNDYQLKPIQRLIVTSGAYRQSSQFRADYAAKDSGSRLLWRKRPMRIEGEVLRDSCLAVAGTIDWTMGGKSFSDYQASDASNGTAYYEPIDSSDPSAQRRSIYRFVPRGANQGLLEAFDCPDASASAPKRNATTTPLQALALWNSSFSLRISSSLAERAELQTLDSNGQADRKEQVRCLFHLTLQREPQEHEMIAGLQLVQQHRLAALARVLLNSHEFVTVD